MGGAGLEPATSCL